MRLLVIEDEPRFAAQYRGSLACHWPELEIVSHAASTRGMPDPEFLAEGYAAVLVDETPAEGLGLEWLEALGSRPGFAPLVLIADRADGALVERARASGAEAVLPRSAGLDEMVAVLGAAARRQADARAARRAAPHAREAETFGVVRIPGHRRIRRLAARAASELYLAESEPAGALVVVKITRDEEPGSHIDAAFRRFLAEQELVRRIDHPGVVRIHDLGIADEHAFLVMEYFRRGDLRRRMRVGLQPEEALRCAIEIAGILEAMHRAAVLHRDLKPGNVMVRDDGSLALIDFGLARQEALELEITDRGAIFGTPHYMSPEQGHGETVDRRTDLYSLGVILFEMLTGEKPYDADNPMAILYMHRKAPIPRLPAALAPLQPLIDRLLAKRPEERYDSAAETAEAMRRALAELRIAEAGA